MRSATPFFALLVFLLGTVSTAQAQNRAGAPVQGRIGGTVLDAETDEPVYAATVALWNAADSSLVTGAITTDEGRFDIEGLRPGTYYVRISFVGYLSETVSGVAITPPSPRADLGTIHLGPDTAMLDEVEVTAERAMMEVQIDRTVYNTKDQPMSAGGSATDVLRNIPSVEVDMDGQVSLRGSQSVAVLVNGRPAQMSGEMLASFLQSLPANTIERVEVIPNPSAKYEPDGMSGILNIVLAQDADLGISGAVTAGGDTQGEYNLSGMVGYGKGPLNARLNYGLRHGSRAGFSERFNEYRLRNPLDYLETVSEDERTSLSHVVSGNADYRLSRLNTLSASGMVSMRSGDSRELNAYDELDALRDVTGRYERRSLESGSDLNLDGALSFARVIEAGTHELEAELRYEREREDEDEDYRQEVLSGVVGAEEELERAIMAERSSELSFEVDYVRPFLREDGKLEAGYKGSLDQLDSDYFAEFYDYTTDAYVPDLTQNNTFLFEEQVHAAYGIVGQQFGRVGMQVGVRLEQALTTFDLTTTGESYENDYFSAFPSAFLTYKFNDVHSLRASYSKRVNRPRTRALNPFSPNDDPLYRRVGNPYLKPEYVHSAELTYTQTSRLGTLSLSPYFRRTVDQISQYQSIDERGVTTLTYQNFATSESFGAEAIGSIRFGRSFNAFASFNAYRVSTDGSNVESSLSNNAIGWTARFNGTYEVTPTLSVQGSFFYRAPMDIEQGRIASFSRTDLALRQRLFGERASLSLRVSDPFAMSGFSITRDTPQFYLESSRQWESRSVSLTFTYNFGKQDRRDRRRDDARDQGDAFGGGDTEFDG